MSFSADVKAELAHLKLNKKCCQLAEIAGFLRVSGSIKLAGGGKFSIVASTENSAIARHFKKAIEEYFHIEVSLGIGDSMVPGKRSSKSPYRFYLFMPSVEDAMQLLRETGMLLVKEGTNYLSDGIYPQIIRTKCCRKAYLRGLFLGCGTISDPKKSNHLEFVIDSEKTANEVRKLIGSFVDLSAGVTQRRKDYIVYIKKVAYIMDMLKLIGADEAVREYETIRMGKRLSRDTKRLMNCDSANVDRTVAAAEEQLEWIRIIDKQYGLEWLPAQLREVAQLRLDMPDASLEEIGEALAKPIKKAGVSKRFSKLKAMAEDIKKNGESNV